MAREYYPQDVIEIALSKAEGQPFERFAQALNTYLVGSDFVPTGGVGDGGADGFTEPLWENPTKPSNFFQATIRPDSATKIRQTVARLREVGREPRALSYFTSEQVSKPDLLESTLSEELDVTIRIRDRSFIAAHVNEDPAVQSAFRQHLSHYADFLRSVGSSKLIPISRHVKSPAVYAFLAQEVTRREGDSSSLNAMADALILWALEGTDPDRDLFMKREDVLAKIASELPSAEEVLSPVIGPRLESLSAKGMRQVRWHEKEDKFCLPFESRRVIEEDNAADILLVAAVETSLRGRAALAHTELSERQLDSAAEVALRALQLVFERQGLEFAAFLKNTADSQDHPDVSECIQEALELCSVTGGSAATIGVVVFDILRAVFYDSTADERLYLSRLSTTYALLFILNTEPRLLEFFQDMAGDFYLYVGSDQLLGALSEHYLPEADQMSTNSLRIAANLGADLVLTEVVANEIVSHLRRCDREFTNHIAASESYMTYEIARNVGPIMLRAYLYTRLNPKLNHRPAAWSAFVQQFCTYDDLHRDAAQDEIIAYLIKKFGMSFASTEELEDLVNVDDVARLAKDLASEKRRQELAEHDALIAHAVYGRRREKKEIASANEFGYSTWWLTGETSILRHSKSLVKENHAARYMMRPEFLLNFVTLAPAAAAARKSFASIFPSLLGVRLAKRMTPTAFNDVLAKVEEASALDEARRAVAIGQISDKLKGDFSRTYTNGYRDSIDTNAESLHDV